MTLYHESAMDATLADALIVGGEQYYLYGDVAHMMRPWLQTGFEGILSPDQDAHNNAMKVPRTAVEWGFKDVQQVCSSLDFSRKLKIREGPVGLLYKTGALVWNLRCCVYGGPTSTFLIAHRPRGGSILVFLVLERRAWEVRMRVRSDAVTICPPPPPPCNPRTRPMYLAADATLDATTEELSLPAADGGAAAGDGAAHEMAARPPAAPSVTRWRRGRRRWCGSRDGGAATGVGVAHEIASPNGTLRAPVVEAAAAGRVGATTATAPTHPLPCSDSAVIAAFAPSLCSPPAVAPRPMRSTSPR